MDTPFTHYTHFRASLECLVDSRPYRVYRIYDADDVLLYVGSTRSFKRRMQEHRSNSKWLPEVYRIEHATVFGRPLALRAESAAILRLMPLHNVVDPLGADLKR